MRTADLTSSPKEETPVGRRWSTSHRWPPTTLWQNGVALFAATSRKEKNLRLGKGIASIKNMTHKSEMYYELSLVQAGIEKMTRH